MPSLKREVMVAAEPVGIAEIEKSWLRETPGRTVVRSKP
jgi:hypothetical protein